MNLIAIKIGGSILTDKKNGQKSVNLDLLKSLTKIIGDYCRISGCKVLLGHGAGSFGHIKAKKLLSEISDLSQSEIQLRLEEIHNDVLDLNEIVKQSADKNIEADNLEGIVFGDVNFSGPNYIVSTEEQFLATGLKFSKVILLTDEDGIYKDYEKPELGIIAEIKLNEMDFSEINFSESTDATGGMQQKLKMASQLLTVSTEVVILNGKKPERLTNELNGIQDVGTRISQ